VDVPALSASQERVRFGDFDVDLRSCELRKRGLRIKLQVQPFQVLLALLERPGNVVRRRELQKRIWPADTFVDFDQGLNNAVKRLREALDDDAEKPRFIETLSKRGYRFIGSVQDEGMRTTKAEAAPADFAERRAEPTDKVEAAISSRQVEVSPLSEKATVPLGGFSRGLATGVLISALVVAVFLLHSYSGQFGELLIQLGQRLEAKPAMHEVMSALTPVPAAAPKADPQQPAASSIRVRIPFSPLEKPFLLRVTEAAEPRNAELAPAPFGAETSPTFLLTDFPMSPVAHDLNLTSLVESIELAKPELVNDSARNTRDLVPPYTDSSAGKYLHVGKFRDGLRANQVMDELEQLGYDGVIVHNRSLWLNSYHIMVGPYTNEGELAAARPGLESRGFSPQVLRSESRRVSLPPMTVYGTDLRIKDCIVSSELNSPEATVRFLKGRRVIATVRGKWEKREFVPKWNAIISLVKEHGPETLLEIQWADTDKVLVLDGEAFRFYFPPS
jgi:DNA-binding winged helix-turn-helix (wHTH) protein